MTWQILIAAAKVIQKRLINLPRSNIFTFDHHYLFDIFSFGPSFQNSSFQDLKNWDKSHESRKQHLLEPTFSKGLTKLAILPDYKRP